MAMTSKQPPPAVPISNNDEQWAKAWDRGRWSVVSIHLLDMWTATFCGICFLISFPFHCGQKQQTIWDKKREEKET